MSSKSKQMAPSSAFAAATQASARRQVINEATGQAPPVDLTRVPVEQLVGSPENPREALTGLDELAQSLRQHGLRQPLSVMPTEAFVRVHPEHEGAIGDAVFVVVNGNRRLAAAQQAGLETLAVHVTELDSSDAVKVAALVENIHREDLSPLDEAAALRALLDVYDTNAEVARQVGKERAWVGQRLALLNLAPDLMDALKSGELKIKEARRLGTLPVKEQHAEWERVVNPVYNEEPGPEVHTPASDVHESAPAERPEGDRAPVNPVYNEPAPEREAQDQDQAAPTREEAGSGPSVVNPVYNEEPGADGPTADQSRSTPGQNRVRDTEPVQLTLELEWEPAAAASEIVSAYGRDRASELAEAIIAQL